MSHRLLRPRTPVGPFALGLAAAAALAGCGASESYYSGDAPEITSISPDFEDGITGCSVVRIQVDDPAQCASPSVVFGNRNAVVVTEANRVAVAKYCGLADIEPRTDSITVVTPPGPIATGKVDVRLACEGGIATSSPDAGGGYDYRVSRQVPGTDIVQPVFGELFEDEVGSFSLQYYDSTLFGGVPFLAGYGFLNGQPAPRGAAFWGGDQDSVASSTGIRAQIPPRSYAPPDVDRIQAGDLLRFYRNRNVAVDPVGEQSSIAWLQVYQPDGRVSFHEVGELSSDSGRRNILVLDEDDPIDVETGEYFCQICLGSGSGPTGGVGGVPTDEDCLDYETFSELHLVQGATEVELPEELAIEFGWDQDIRYYYNDYMGPNSSPVDKPLCLSYGSSFSYGVNIEAHDYGATCASGQDTTAEINGAGAITFPGMDMDFINDNSTAPDGTEGGAALSLNFGAVHTPYAALEGLAAPDWDAFDPRSQDTCNGLLLKWDYRTASNPDRADGGDFALTENDFYTVNFRIWDDLMPSNFFGTFEVFRLTAFGWHRAGGICVPASELAKAPPTMFPFGSTIAQDDAYVSTRYVAYAYINHHRVQKVPMPGVGNMVVDVKKINVTLFSNITACEDLADNDGDGLVDAEDPGCLHSDGYFEGVTACNNSQDDDGDGWADSKDPGCYVRAQYDPKGEDERGYSQAYACNDGIDNDGDGRIDRNDPVCRNADVTLPDGTEVNDGSGFGPSEVHATCMDGIDADGDGWTDLADPECTEANNQDEDEIQSTTGFGCDDGLDGDGDGWIDAADPGCEDGYDEDESNTGFACSDGVDGDGDGWVDAFDPGCSDPTDDDEDGFSGTECNDGLDGDGDGWIDAADPGCADAQGEDEGGFSATECNDGIDNDADGLSDADDPECALAGSGAWDAEGEPPQPACGDGIDNDGDGWIDSSEDPGCAGDPEGADEGGFGSNACNDGADNDGDTFVDADDPDCDDASDPSEAETCSDGLDNDGDGWFDAQDPECQLGEFAEDDVNNPSPAECNDGLDNDGDELVDAQDPECIAASDGSWDSETTSP